MSRGKLISATSWVTGSMLATISVSVRAWLRVSAESTPVSRMLIRERGVAGVANGTTITGSLGSADSPGEGDGVAPRTCPASAPSLAPTKIRVPAS